MSIFDLYEKFLPGDKRQRKLKFLYSEYKADYQSNPPGQNEDNTTFPRTNRVFWPFYTLCGVVLVILVLQLLNLQISQGSFNRVLAEGNRIRQRQVISPRGLIYDRDGKSLAINEASYCIEIYPLDLPKSEEERDNYYEKISQIIQIPKEEIKKEIKNKGFNQADPVVLKENMDRDSAMLLEVKTVNLPGVVIEKKPVRNYSTIMGLSQILGYVGKVSDNELKNNAKYQMNELIGKDGLEKTYQDFLKGRDGINEIEVDAHGRAQRLLSNLPPAPGNSLTLSLDGGLEGEMARILQSKLDETKSSAGAAVAINPKTGAVLGMVSLPSYDNNVFIKSISSAEYEKLLNDPLKPMFNRSISGTYPSGSTIKPMVAAGALQEGNITANTTIKDEGEIKVGNYTYPDWKAHGLVDVRKAIAQSCDVFFYSLGGGWDKIKGLGVAKLHDYLAKFGLGKTLGIDLPGEANGLVPSPEWKEKAKKESWYLGDTYHMSIGQGDVLVTPLQMASAIASIANGGELLKPYLVQTIKDNDGQVVKETQKTVLNKDFISADNIQIVREGMRQAVTSGSASQFNDLPFQVAAKTGTAQFGDQDKTHAWMVAFAPYDDPQIAIAVIIEGAGEGYAAAGPVVKDSLSWYFSH